MQSNVKCSSYCPPTLSIRFGAGVLVCVCVRIVKSSCRNFISAMAALSNELCKHSSREKWKGENEFSIKTKDGHPFIHPSNFVLFGYLFSSFLPLSLPAWCFMHARCSRCVFFASLVVRSSPNEFCYCCYFYILMEKSNWNGWCACVCSTMRMQSAWMYYRMLK